MTAAFSPSRIAALERLSAFLPHAGRDYAARRNYDLGPGRHVHVSGLSPYLRCRLLTEEEVIAAVLGCHSYTASEKFVQEVFWRTYWKGWLELRPAVWEHYQQTLLRDWNRIQTEAGLRTQWETACHGQTGIACFDAWAQELVETGYMHNHARMWFASIWIFTLKLPWSLGADFFLRHLLDGDPASNTLSWRWVAGIQTRGKTYLARTSNIAKYTEARFHPKWQLAGEAVPLDAPAPPMPRALPPLPPVDPDARTGFLLHDEDLSPGFVLNRLDPVSFATLAPQTDYGPLHTSRGVHAFRTAAIQEASGRWGRQFGDIPILENAEDVRSWAQSNAVEQIITPYAPVGPTAQTLEALETLKGAPQLCRVLRPFDAKAWPHATKGFFPFRKKIPQFIFHFNGNAAF